MKRSKFSLSHYKLLTCKMGQLVPVAWFEALPGDTIQQATSALVRCAPLVTPVMHPVQVRFHHWFVPNRIIWSDWENFITGGQDGLNASQAPYFQNSGTPHAVSSLDDHLGAPTGTPSAGFPISALPYRAYAMIWNEFYRDQDLMTPIPISKASGLDSTTGRALQNICWEKDYLTSARPWAQKGAQVTMPLGQTAPIEATGVLQLGEPGNPGNVRRAAATAGATLTISSAGTASADLQYVAGLRANLAGATAVDVNTVRQAFALQRFEEARARYGSRYTEYLRYLGVRSSDARLQRPEYLGGGRNTIQFSEVLQTAPETGAGVGKMFGHGITAMRTNRYRRFFEEHGIVMTLMSVRPKTMYSQRLPRKFLRGISSNVLGTFGNKLDYWQREIQHVGQQAIQGMEVDVLDPNFIFAYQDRYDEYRREESSVAGLFRTTLNNWHLSREFATAPTMNASFLSCVPSTRIFQDLNADNLYIMANHSIQARRLIAREGTSMTF